MLRPYATVTEWPQRSWSKLSNADRGSLSNRWTLPMQFMEALVKIPSNNGEQHELHVGSKMRFAK